MKTSFIFSVGYVEGVPFIACTSGASIIILASNFQRIQQITTNSNINSIDSSTDVGKIAASYEDKIVIFEPPSSNATNKLEYKWIQSAKIESDIQINVMSFNLDGTRLLAGGDAIQLWALQSTKQSTWHCIWKCKPANHIYYLKYSPDGTLFCSASKHDRIIKIWYESSATNSSLNFSFIYISHPKAISGLEWRRTCKYAARGRIANILITSCKDNISRIWVQTLLPDDGVICLDQQQNDDKGVVPRFQHQPHRQKFLKRLIKAFSQFKKKQPLSNNSIQDIEKVANSSDTCSLNPSLIKPNLHFHLAGIISANNSNSEKSSNSQFVVHWVNNKLIHITLSIESLCNDMITRLLQSENNPASSNISPQSVDGSCSGSGNDTDEVDNQDDTITAESSKKLRHKLCHKMNKQRALAASGRKDPADGLDDGSNHNSVSRSTSGNTNGRISPTALIEEFDKTLEYFLERWPTSPDLLFSINKSDGTFTLWQAKYLDGEETGVFRNVQIDELSNLKSALPDYDATTMSTNVTAYFPSAYPEVKRALDLVVGNPSSLSKNNSETNSETIANNSETNLNTQSEMEPGIFIVTQHLSGILGLWKLGFDTTYPKVRSVDLVTRITGLPIEPTWLRDGFLCIEHNEDDERLTTKWLPDNQGFSIEPQKESHVIDKIKASQVANSLNILPQYHQKQLIELLAFGKLQRIKAILNHLVTCLVSSDPKNNNVTSPGPRAHRSRTLSIVSHSPPVFPESFDLDESINVQQQVIEEVELDYTEITSIQPLPLYSLLEADDEKPAASETNVKEDFSEDFGTYFRARSQVEETLDEILGKSTIDTMNKQKQKLDSQATEFSYSLTHFNSRKASTLTKMLTHTHLPGLTNIDQMHLLAVADAVALFDASPSDYSETLGDEDTSDSTATTATNIAIDSLDDRGLRFLTAMRQHIYLTKCLPMKQQNELKASGIGNHNIVWGFHSDSQEELLSLIPCVKRNKPEWAELREFGVGWWLRKLEVLRKLIEKTAQSAYQAKQDPLDAALFYLAMKKKTLVCALLRRVNCDKRLLKLFEQDFSDPVNRRKALKNAYALLGLHRFEHAAAFFILAGSIWDAVEVCINNLNDIQLAIVLIRLHDSEHNIPANLKKLLFAEVLGSKGKDESEFSYNPERACKDPFLRSVAFWQLGDYASAFYTLIEKETSNNTTDTVSYKGSVFNFYLYIKDLPLVQRHKQTSMDEDSGGFEKGSVIERERQLMFSEAQSYLDSGCPLLALEVLSSDKSLRDCKAQRMKFMACLHILLNELCTVSPGGSFMEWLKRSSEAMEMICKYGGTSSISPEMDSNQDTDSQWIERNKPILRTMLTYCNLRCSKESSLIIIRQDLLSLIDSYKIIA